jgi:hypothetical protein
MEPESQLRNALDRLLQARKLGPLTDVVTTWRDAGQSWTRIAAELYRLTGVHVTGGTVRRWFA